MNPIALIGRIRRVWVVIGLAAFAALPAGAQDSFVIPSGSVVELYVSNYAGDTVSVVQTARATNPVVATIKVGRGPSAIVHAQDIGKVYVANYNDGTISVIDDNYRVATTIPVGRGPIEVQYVEGRTYPTGEVQKPRLYVANFFDATVSVIDAERDVVIETIAVGRKPLTLQYDPACAAMYVLASASIEAVTIDTLGRQPVHRFLYPGLQPIRLQSLDRFALDTSGANASNASMYYSGDFNAYVFLDLDRKGARPGAAVCQELPLINPVRISVAPLLEIASVADFYPIPVPESVVPPDVRAAFPNDRFYLVITTGFYSDNLDLRLLRMSRDATGADFVLVDDDNNFELKLPPNTYPAGLGITVSADRKEANFVFAQYGKASLAILNAGGSAVERTIPVGAGPTSMAVTIRNVGTGEFVPRNKRR